MSKSGYFRISMAVIIFLAVACPLFSIKEMSSMDELFSPVSETVVASDSELGILSDLSQVHDGEIFSNLLDLLLLQEPENDTIRELLADDTNLMFMVLHSETLFPKLPLAGYLTGEVVSVNDIVRIPLRLLMKGPGLSGTGEIFLVETEDGWKIYSADFDFTSGSENSSENN